MQHKLLHPRRLFTYFKYAVYLCLTFNTVEFLREDLLQAQLWLGPDQSLRELSQAFAQTIDSLAWLVLLLLFELETSFIPDSVLRHRRVRWSLHGVRALCALVVLGSVAGYAGKLGSYRDASVFGGDPCLLAGTEEWSVLTGHGEQAPLDAGNCASLGQALELHTLRMLAPVDVFDDVVGLARVDVINAMAWVVVVLLLELDVRLQLKGRLEGWVLRSSSAAKFLTYAVLLAAAVYWGFEGDFLDFWDAFLWLVAFVFIEMNIFQWHQEEAELAAQPTVRTA